MKNTRKLGLLIVIIGLILFAILIYYSFFRSSVGPEDPAETGPLPIETGFPETDEPRITPSDRPVDYQRYDISQEAPHIVGLEDATKRAMIFAERLGSFSSQSTFSNIVDLQLFMTSNMRTWSDSYIQRLRNQYPSDSYYKVSTYSLSTKVLKYSQEEGEAEILVTTYRSEEDDDEENNFLQDMLIELVLENNRWLVNGVYWQDI
jgi:hypothetical protein